MGVEKREKGDWVCTPVGFILFIQICNLTHRLLDWKGVQPSLCPIGLDWIGCMQKRVLLSWFLIVVVVVHCPELRGVFYLSTLSSSLPHRAACFSFSISPTEIRVTLPLYFSTLSLCLRSLRRFLSSFFSPSSFSSLFFAIPPPSFPSFIQLYSFTHTYTTILYTLPHYFFSSHHHFLLQLIPSLSLCFPHCSPSFPFTFTFTFLPSLPSNPCVFSSRFYFLSPLSLSLTVTLSTHDTFFISSLSRSLFSPPLTFGLISLPTAFSDSHPSIEILFKKRDTFKKKKKWSENYSTTW